MDLTIKRNMLKYQTGQAMFCPACRTIMDCRRAVSVDILKGSDLLKTMITCAACHDKTVIPALDKLAGKFASEGVTVELADGRVLFARPKKNRKAAA